MLSGKSRNKKNFSQTIPLRPPCVVLWEESIENFIVIPIAGEVSDTAELVDVILRVED